MTSRRKFPEMALTGLVAGLIGGWAMSQFSFLWNRLPRSRPNLIPYSPQEWDTTKNVAQFAARRLLGRPLSERDQRAGAALVHYGTAAVAGLVYATALSAPLRAKNWSGPLYGLAVWAVGNEVLMPALGFEKKPAQYTPSMQAQAVGEHLVYGLTLQLLCGRYV